MEQHPSPTDPGKSKAHDLAIQREKEKHAATIKPQKPKIKPKEETPRVKAIRKVENKIRKQEYESAALIDDFGNEIFFKDGQRSQVGFTRFECMSMKNNTLTHNHPRCSMFSKEDLNCMLVNEMQEIRATNRDGTTYSMRKAETGFSKYKALDFVDAYNKEYLKATMHAQRELDKKGYREKIWNGEITQDEANIEFGRSSAQYMVDYTAREAPKYGLVFTVEQTTVTKSMRGVELMKSDGENSDYLVLDEETNALEDKAFKEWLEKAEKGNKAKSFNDLKERSL